MPNLSDLNSLNISISLTCLSLKKMQINTIKMMKLMVGRCLFTFFDLMMS